MKSHCLEYDADDMLSMIIDIVTEPRSLLVGEIAKTKLRKQHELVKHMLQFDPHANATDLLMKTAYGNNTLDMPL